MTHEFSGIVIDGPAKGKTYHATTRYVECIVFFQDRPAAIAVYERDDDKGGWVFLRMLER